MPTNMKINDVLLPGVVSVSESGGMQAPTKKVEKGFIFGSKVHSEAVSATVEAFVKPEKYQSLSGLRESDKPVTVTIGFVSLGACKVSDISVDQSATRKSHFKTTIKVSQIKEASTGTATLSVSTGGGGEGGGGGGTTQSGSSEGQEATLVRSTQENASNPDDGLNDGSAIGTVKEWLGID
jgi:hypothetical protein